jgi:hypothetical protein
MSTKILSEKNNDGKTKENVEISSKKSGKTGIFSLINPDYAKAQNNAPYLRSKALPVGSKEYAEIAKNPKWKLTNTI